MTLYSLSGDAPPEKRWHPVAEKAETILDWGGLPEKLPKWLSEKDLVTLKQEFSRTGFLGDLNWYRNIDRNWELTSFLADAPISQPALFLAGKRDPIVEVYGKFESQLEKWLPNLKARIFLEGIGHWTTQEDPATVTKHLADFLSPDFA